MAEYLTGDQVIAVLKIHAFELLALAKQGLIRPYTRQWLPVHNVEEKRAVENSEGHCLFIWRICILMKKTEDSLPCSTVFLSIGNCAYMI